MVCAIIKYIEGSGSFCEIKRNLKKGRFPVKMLVTGVIFSKHSYRYKSGQFNGSEFNIASRCSAFGSSPLPLEELQENSDDQ